MEYETPQTMEPICAKMEDRGADHVLEVAPNAPAPAATPPAAAARAVSELQPTINVGMIGHVAHGKSTVVKQLSGVSTAKHSRELRRNMTIKLGYANAKVFRCENEACPRPSCYKALPSSLATELHEEGGRPLCGRKGCGYAMRLVRHVSFVDCPGHEMLMSTMLNAAALMDAALLVVAANEPCPRPQTAEHLAAGEVMGLPVAAILHNKVDLVGHEGALLHASSLASFVSGTAAERVPVIPVSAQVGINMDAVAMALAERLPDPARDLSAPPRMSAVRSFDVNRPGADWNDLKGAVLGGSLERGTLRLGMALEVRPGRVWKDASSGRMTCQPLLTTVASLSSDKTPLREAVPGGLIGVGTLLDPSLGRDDGLVGQVVGAHGSLPPVFQDLQVRFKLMRRLVGVESHDGDDDDHHNDASSSSSSGGRGRVEPIVAKERLLLHVGTNSCVGIVRAAKGRLMNVRLLDMPVCADIGQRIAFSRHVGEDHWRLVGWGVITPKSSPIEIHCPKAALSPALSSCAATTSYAPASSSSPIACE